MTHTRTRRLLMLAFSLLSLQATAACTNNNASLGGGVAQAYNSTGMFEVPTYTRSIFSSTNF